MKSRELDLLTAKACYGHLGGTLGNRLFARLIELGWFKADEGQVRRYSITAEGIKQLENLGVNIYEGRYL